VGAFATVAEIDGVRSTSAAVDGFVVAELEFPPHYVQQPFEPELPYLALVLAGGVEKSFRLRTICFAGSSFLTMPAGAVHGARFGHEGARIVVVRAADAAAPAPACLARFAELRGRGFEWLGWRLAAELRAADSAAPLAVAGLVLQLLAAASREASRSHAPCASWLLAAEELLRARRRECIGLGELAAEVGVGPAHLARAFRARHGVSVGEYGRRLRLSWAAGELASTDKPLAEVAADAGFADQSHFTRAFKRHTGATPAVYRAETRGVPR
jgi:AraC family transcriptional regulator